MKKENFRFIRNIPTSSIQDQYRENYQNSNFQKSEDYLQELLSLQFQLNQALMINNILTDQFIKQADQLNGKTSSSEGSTLTSGLQKRFTQTNQIRPQDPKLEEKKKNKRSYIKAHKQKSQSEYEPSEEQQLLVQYKLSQSKNVPKNYGKAILNFIKKNQTYVKKVLIYLNQNHALFQEYLKKFKNNINTIAELRSLWLEEKGNIYAKAIRIISIEYLRKYALTHIFNSRVQNFGKHIKYRQKIINAVSKPQQFTQMKDY